MEMVAAACDAATRTVLDKLRNGSLHPEVPRIEPGAAIGVGQSMGGHLVVVTQANHRTFDAIGILGSSFTQTRLNRLAGRRYPPRYEEPEVIMRASQTDTDLSVAFHWHEEPPTLVSADMAPDVTPAWRTKAIPRFAGLLMLPAIVAREAAAVRSPVLLAYGEIDVTVEPLADAAMFRSTSDLTLLIVPRMAHMHNFAPTRQRLWRRLSEFAIRVARDARLE
jgi:pimeloyl-ACP methyl ester carboxylesterase